MKSKKGSMDHKVYRMSFLLHGLKATGCKWIFKRNMGLDEKVQTFKAKLVTKGYTHLEDIDYEETFSLVAILKSVCILLYIATHLDYEI